MKVTRKLLNVMADNLCLSTSNLSSILKSCTCIEDIFTIDLGLNNELLENRFKKTLVSLMLNHKE